MDATKTTIILLIITLSLTYFVDCGVILITPSTLASFPKDFTNCSGALNHHADRVVHVSLSHSFNHKISNVPFVSAFKLHNNCCIYVYIVTALVCYSTVKPRFNGTLQLCDTLKLSKFLTSKSSNSCGDNYFLISRPQWR